MTDTKPSESEHASNMSLASNSHAESPPHTPRESELEEELKDAVNAVAAAYMLVCTEHPYLDKLRDGLKEAIEALVRPAQSGVTLTANTESPPETPQPESELVKAIESRCEAIVRLTKGDPSENEFHEGEYEMAFSILKMIRNARTDSSLQTESESEVIGKHTGNTDAQSKRVIVDLTAALDDSHRIQLEIERYWQKIHGEMVDAGIKREDRIAELQAENKRLLTELEKMNARTTK